MATPRSTHSHPSRPSVRKHAWFLASGILAAGLVLGILQSTLSHTSLTEGSYSTNGLKKSFTFPLKIASQPAGDVTVDFILHVGSIRPSLYYILADDCLQMFTVNGTVVESPVVPYCDYTHGRILDLSEHLKTGDNAITMQLHNNVGDVGLLLRPSFNDTVSLLPYLILLIAFIAAGTVLVTLLRIPAWGAGTLVLLLAGSIVRLQYMLTSPYWIRNHDADAHLEYIQYLQTHLSIPLPNAGWEFWQPPLYYFFGALWMGIASLLKLQHGQAVIGLQYGALLLSIASLFLFAWIAWMALPEKMRPVGMPVFAALLAFFPGLILQASQINNDTLSIALSIAAFGTLVYWWNQSKPALPLWLLLSFLIGLGLLTKSTAILILPVVFGSLLIRKQMSWKQKILWGALSLLTVVAIAGWFTAYRIIQNTGQSLITGNADGLNSGLAIPNSVSMYTIFNPVAVVQIPYNSPWDDATRRQYFLEYWYRSAFFGEFNFGDSLKMLSSWILVWSYAICALMFFGMWKMLRTRLYSFTPFFLFFFFLLIGAMLNRFTYPFTPSQDFRYSLSMLASVAVFSTMGLLSIQSILLKWIAFIGVILFAGSCAMFLLSLHFV